MYIAKRYCSAEGAPREIITADLLQILLLAREDWLNGLTQSGRVRWTLRSCK